MKTLSAALAALSLALAGAASAAPASVSFQQSEIDGYAASLTSGAATAFSDTHSFTLANAVTMSGQIMAVIVDGAPDATIPYLDIQSAYLLSGTGQRIDLTQTTGFDWAHGSGGVEVWTLSPVELVAGEWQLVVTGLGINDKGADGYDARLTAEAAELPEPTALALVATALTALSLARRRRAD